MAWQLKSNESISQGVQRIALEQIRISLKNLSDPNADFDITIHEIRKTYKKIRALLRYFKQSLDKDKYKKHNQFFRDSARHISQIRDSFVQVETFEALAEKYKEDLNQEYCEIVRQELNKTYGVHKCSSTSDATITQEIKKHLKQSRKLIKAWPSPKDDQEILESGLRKLYKTGKKYLKLCHQEPTSEHFHELRKQVKYLWYQISIFRPCFPELINRIASLFHELSNLLGTEHDLHILRQAITRMSDPSNQGILGYPDLDCQREQLFTKIATWQSEIQSEALRLGDRLLIESPSEFSQRFFNYWKLFQQPQK